MILLSNSKNKISTAKRYIEEISKADDLPIEEIDKNRERNADLIVDHQWSVEQLFQFYKHKLNCPAIVTRTGFSIDRGLKKNQLYHEYFKECTFRPKITKKAHDVEEKKTRMLKVAQHLNVFDADGHELESMGVSDAHNSNTNSAQKSNFNRNSRFKPLRSRKLRKILQFYWF